MSELPNISALVSSHVIGLTSRASFFIRLQMFSIEFPSGDCGGYNILRLSLFSKHGSVTRSIV